MNNKQKTITTATHATLALTQRNLIVNVQLQQHPLAVWERCKNNMNTLWEKGLSFGTKLVLRSLTPLNYLRCEVNMTVTQRIVVVIQRSLTVHLLCFFVTF